MALKQRSYWLPGRTILRGLDSKRLSKAMTEIENTLLIVQRFQPELGAELEQMYEQGGIGATMEILIDRVRLSEEARGRTHA